MSKAKLHLQKQNILLVTFFILFGINQKSFSQQPTLFPEATWLQDVHWSGTIYAGVPAPIMPSVQAHLNGREYMFHLKSDVEKARPLIDAVHAQGKKYWVNLDGYLLEGSVDSVLNDGQGITDPNFGAFHSLEGNIIYSGETVTRNINRPEWRNFLISSIKRAIDAGADGSQHDGGATSNNESFDDEELDAFENYVQSHSISTGDWNPSVQNFKEYLISNGKNDNNVFDNDSDPQNVKDLIEHWYDFKAVNTKNSWQMVKDSCTAYANSLGQDYTIALNAGSAIGTRFGHTYFVGDYAIGEFFGWGNLFPFNGTLAAKAKAFEALDKRFVCWSSPTLEDIPLANPYDNYPSYIQKEADMHLISTLYASGGLPQLKFPVADSYPAYLLAQVNRELLNSVTSPTDIAVVMSHAQTIQDNRGFEGLVSVLQDLSKSFKVEFFKSNRLDVADDLTLSDLSGYKVIFLPEVFYLTDNQRSLLLSFMNAGGTVIAVRGNVEYSGWVDENGNTQTNSTWSSLADETESVIKIYGQGKFINIAHNIMENTGYPLVSYGADYMRFKYSSDSYEAQLAESIKDTIDFWFNEAFPKPDIYSENLPNHLRVFKYQDTLAHSYVFHFISDSVQIPSRAPITTQSFNVELRVAEASYSKLLQARFYSIDNPYGELVATNLAVNPETGRVNFTLPSFNRWGFIHLEGTSENNLVEIKDLKVNGGLMPYRLKSGSSAEFSWEVVNGSPTKYQIEVWTNLQGLGDPIVSGSNSISTMPAIDNYKLALAKKVFTTTFETESNSYSISGEQLRDSTVYFARLRVIENTDTSKWIQQFFYRNGKPGIPKEHMIYVSHQDLWYRWSAETPMTPPDTNSTLVFSYQKGEDNKGRYGGDYELDTLSYGINVYTDSLDSKKGGINSDLHLIGTYFTNRLGPFEGSDDIFDTLDYDLGAYENYGIYIAPLANDGIDTSNQGELLGFYLDQRNDPPNEFNLISPNHNSYTQEQIPFSWKSNGDPDPFNKENYTISKVEILFDTTTTFDSPAFRSYQKDRGGSEYEQDTITLNLPTNFFTAEGFMNYEKIYWKVKMYDYDRDVAEGGGSGVLSKESEDVYTLFIGAEPQVPNTPNQIEPVDNSVNVKLTDKLVWQSITNATSYTIQISTDSAFSKNIFTLEEIYSNELVISELENDVKYFWRIKSMNGGVGSEWSTIWSFKTIVRNPDQVQIINPNYFQTVTTDTVKFMWRQSNPVITNYWFEYSTDSLFSTSVIDSMIIDTVKYVSDLENNTTYWWKVKAKNIAGWGEFSDVNSFDLVITSLKDNSEIPTKYELSQNYPNPFNPSTVIEFAIPLESKVEIVLYNLLGQKIMEILNDNLSAGRYSREVNLVNLSSGIYIYQLRSDKFVQTKKMILAK